MSQPSWYEQAAREHFAALYAEGRFASTREAARIIGVGKTAASEFMRYFREHWGPVVPSAEPDAEQVTAAHDGATWTDERSGTVFTDLGEYGVISFTQGEFRSIRRDYSKHYGGKALTRQELALRYRFPTIAAFEVFARIHELRQNALPFTDDEIEQDGVDALVDKSIESKRQEFFLKLSAKEREQEKRDAERWRAFEANARLIAAEVRGLAAAPEPSAFVPHNDPGPFIAICNLQDVHIGKLCLNSRGERIYDRQTAVTRLKTATNDLFGKIVRYGTPEAIMLVIGGDLLHVDGPAMLTSSLKTSQAGQSDGTYREIVTDAVGVIMDQIRLARLLTRVQVLIVHGNHDAQSCLWLGILLEQAFAGDERVSVVMQEDGAVVRNYGENTILAIHGENLKEADAYRVIGNAAQEAGIPLQKSKLVLTGHRHHERIIDLNGVELHQCASLSEADAWHTKNHFNHSVVRASALIVNRKGGKAAILYSDPDAYAPVPARGLASTRAS